MASALVLGVNEKRREFAVTAAKDFVMERLRDPRVVVGSVDRRLDERYQLAAEMKGAGRIFYSSETLRCDRLAQRQRTR